MNNFNIQDGGQNKKQSNIVTKHLQLHTNPFNGNIQRKMPNFIIIYECNFTLAHENREMQKDCINFNHKYDKREIIGRKREAGINHLKREVSGQDGMVGMSAWAIDS